jgi:hypothetical protein
MKECAVHKSNCQALPETLQKHHIQPRAMGGATEPGNIVLLCPSAHMNVNWFMHMIINNPLTKTGTFIDIHLAGRVKGHEQEYLIAHDGWLMWRAAGKPGRPELLGEFNAD